MSERNESMEVTSNEGNELEGRNFPGNRSADMVPSSREAEAGSELPKLEHLELFDNENGEKTMRKKQP